MMIVGVDYHPSFQTIAFLSEETGACGEQELKHSDGEAERFYRDLQKRGIRVRVGMEATGYSRWFERLLAELGFEVWMGDPAEIKAKRVKKQKFDREDARLLLRLMRENNRHDGAAHTRACRYKGWPNFDKLLSPVSSPVRGLW
ncbi:MAG: transposase [Candidatus Acidiferrum sp.]